MGRSRWIPAPAIAVAFVLAAGCLGGDHTFPDDSDQVRSLHVNAYEATSGAAPRPAILEISGPGADHQERAFHGHVHILVEKAIHPEANVRYEKVKEYDADVASNDFSSPTVPYWKSMVPAADIPATATYRASATATIAGASFDANALFDHRA